MYSMSYCRHENAAADLESVWEEWDDYTHGKNGYEDRARKRIVRLVGEMHERFVDDGEYDDEDES